MADFLVVGVNHRSGTAALREALYVEQERQPELLARLKAAGIVEAVFLSTCDRSEVQAVASDAEATTAAVGAAFAGQAGVPAEEVAAQSYCLTGGEALRHIFAVAASLDSQVIGEPQVLGQVKAAHARARAAGRMAGALDRALQAAFAGAKRVRSETAIGESPASVSSAAGALAAQVFGDLAGRRVMLIGAGRIGELAAANLASRGAQIAYIANRTVDTARELSHRFGGEALALPDIASRLGDVDVVVSSTSAPETVVQAGDVPAKRRTPLFFIDIAVPRDLDSAIAKLDGCFLYDIDDLEAVVAETLSGRRSEAARAEQFVAEEAERFRSWRASLDVVPAIASLRARAEEIRSAELAKVDGRMSADERRTLESVTAQILNKLLHLPTVRMKEAAVSSDGAAYADAVRHLFGLDEENKR